MKGIELEEGGNRWIVQLRVYDWTSVKIELSRSVNDLVLYSEQITMTEYCGNERAKDYINTYSKKEAREFVKRYLRYP